MIGGELKTGVSGHPGADLAMDLTPLLDVLFMVLVFFLLTANSVPIALQLDLPRESSSSAQPVQRDDLLRVTITDEEANWLINDQSFASWETARAQLLLLHQQQTDVPVIIAAARQAPLERMVSVLAFLADEQIPVVQVLLDPDGAAMSSDQTQ